MDITKISKEKLIRHVFILQQEHEALSSYHEVTKDEVELNEAIMVAMEALMKQIPMRPIPLYRSLYQCPNRDCDHHVFREGVCEALDSNINGSIITVCSCGQKILWEGNKHA